MLFRDKVPITTGKQSVNVLIMKYTIGENIAQLIHVLAFSVITGQVSICNYRKGTILSGGLHN